MRESFELKLNQSQIPIMASEQLMFRAFELVHFINLSVRPDFFNNQRLFQLHYIACRKGFIAFQKIDFLSARHIQFS